MVSGMDARRDVLYLAGGLLVVAAVYAVARGAKGIGGDIGRAAVDAVDGVLSGVVVGAGELVGIPESNADKARALMDAYPAAHWYEQAAMAFQISAYASAADYLRWVVDKSYRPAPGAY